MKRLSILWVFICLMFNAFAYDFSAVNADGVTIYYNILTSSTVEVTANTPGGYTNVVNIPTTVTNLGTTYTVTGIDDSAFENCAGLTIVTIPTSVTNIGNSAFRNCADLELATLPDVTIAFGTHVFENCISLESFTIPEHITSIPEAFFKGCSSLETVYVTNTLVSISWSAFEGCASLTSTGFTIPTSVVSIGYSAFKGCSSLTTIEIPEGITYLDNNIFQNCTSLNQVTLPSTLTEIKAHVFRGCSSLALINFPDAMTKISYYAFNGCTSLMNVNLSNTAISNIEDYAFKDCTNLTNLTFSNNLTHLGNAAFQNCGEIRHIVFPKSYTAIGDRVFMGCAKLLDVVMQSNTTSIGEEAFKDCIRLDTVRIYAMNPPTAGNNDCFDGILANLVICVPCSAVDAYMAATPYNQFNVTCDPDILITTDVVPFDCGYILGDGYFTTDETVSLVAIPRNHYVFVSWTENDNIISTDSIYSFKAVEDRYITANFRHRDHLITATADPSAYGRVTGGGIYEYSAVARLMAYPYEHYEFFYWTENDSIVSTNTIYRFTVPYDRDLVAHFSPLSYNIHTTVNDTLAGATSGDGVYVYNDTVTVSATTNEHYNFIGWKEYGNIVSTDSIYVFQADRNRNLLAYYEPDYHNINATVNIPGAGTITGAGVYGYNTTATLVATNTQHYTFRTWQENNQTVSTNATYSFTVTGDRDLVANFTLNSYEVTATANIADAGILTGQGTYLCGDSVTMTAQANLHATFVNWTEAGVVVSTDPTFSFVIDGNRHFVANFNVDNYHWTPNITPYNNTMMLTGVIQIDGEEQFSDNFEVGAFCGDVVRGSAKAHLVSAINRYIIYMTIYGNNDDEITFQLYDHSTGQVVDLECITTLTFIQDLIVGSTSNPHVLNFITDLFITAVADPVAGGITMGGGPYSYGDIANMNAVAAEGYSFYNWTENGVIISTNASFSFEVTENRVLTANFVLGNHWNSNPVAYLNSMEMTCVIEINGTEQRSPYLELGAFCGDVVRGSQIAEYVESVDRYIAFIMVYGTSGDEITFRLYDHSTGNESNYISEQNITLTPNAVIGSVNNPYVINFVPAIDITIVIDPEGSGEVTGAGIYPLGSTVTLTAAGFGNYVFVDWSEAGNVLATTPVYSFTATESLVITAYFELGQHTPLSTGWNWYSTYIEMSNIDGLQMIKDNLVDKATLIKSKTEYIEFVGGEWNGTLTSVVNEQMYQIEMVEDYVLGVHGDIAIPENHPITIIPDWNWIGYPMTDSLDVDVALAGYTAVEGDCVRSLETYAEYNEGIGWIGSLKTMVPGEGYQLLNTSNNTKTLIYQNPGKGEVMANRTTRDNYWQPNVHQFANNMCLTSTIKLNRRDFNNENLEIGAFCNGECRGSAHPMYIEQLDKYVTFLTIYGEDGDEITFKLYDAALGQVISELADNGISFNQNEVLGSTSEAFEIEYNSILNVDDNSISVGMYPNPAHSGDNVILTTNAYNSKVEVFNTLGAKIFETIFNEQTTLDCFNNSGVYFIQVTTAEGKAFRKIVIE